MFAIIVSRITKIILSTVLYELIITIKVTGKAAREVILEIIRRRYHADTS